MGGCCGCIGRLRWRKVPRLRGQRRCALITAVLGAGLLAALLLLRLPGDGRSRARCVCVCVCVCARARHTCPSPTHFLTQN